MTSKLKVNILADGGDNAIMTSDGSGSLTINNAALKMTPSFAAKMSAGQSLSNDTSTKIAYDTEVYDTDSAYDHSSNYRFTVPSGKAGKYFIGASARSGTITDTKKITMYFHINGSEVAVNHAATTSTGQQYTVSVFNVIDLSASDYVEVFCLHQSGGSVSFSSSSSIGSYFYGFRIIGA